MKKTKVVSCFIALVFVISAIFASAAYAEVPKQIPVISKAPNNLSWPEGSLAYYQCVCENDKGHEKFTYEWHIIFAENGKDYTVNNFNDAWCKYINASSSDTGLIGNCIYLDGVKQGLSGSEIYCKVIGNDGTVETPRAVISVCEASRFTPPEIIVPVYITCYTGEKVEIKAEAHGTAGNADQFRDYISYHWYRTDTGKLQNIIAIDTGKDMYEDKTFTPDTSKAGTYYYVCGVFDGEENNPKMANYSYSNVITVEVVDKTVEPPTITVQPMSDELTLDEMVALIVEAKAPAGCTLGYQWYTSDKNGYAEMEEMEGEKAYALKVPQIEGDRYYWCAVWSVDEYGNMSTVVATDIAKITYKKPVVPDTTLPDTETDKETEKETEKNTENVTVTEPVNTEDLVPIGTDTQNEGTTGAETKPADTGTANPTTDGPATSGSGVSAVVIVLIIVAVLLTAAIAAVVVLIIVLSKKKK